MSFTYKYPRPAVTVDAVIFSKALSGWQVLLIQRKNEPFQNFWALPGGFLDENEDPDHAVLRELKEETNLSEIKLAPLGFWGRPERDPRGHTISLAYYGTIHTKDHNPRAQDDAKAIAWFPIEALPELAFDHKAVVNSAVQLLQE